MHITIFPLVPITTREAQQHLLLNSYFQQSDALTQGKDYTVSFENNVNAGRASYTIKGLSLYKGTLTSIFHLQCFNRDAEITFDSPLIFIKGTPLTPQTNCHLEGKNTDRGKDYTLSWSNNNENQQGSLPHYCTAET